MGRKAIRTPNISDDYDNSTTVTSVTLPCAYVDYLKKIIPFTEFSSLSELIKVATSEMFPSPESFDKEAEQLGKLAEAFISKKPVKKVKLRTGSKELIHKANKGIMKTKDEGGLSQYERMELDGKFFHIYQEGSKYQFEVTNFEDRSGRLINHSWDRKNFDHSGAFCKEQAQAIWAVHELESLSLFEKEEFVEITADLLMGLSS